MAASIEGGGASLLDLDDLAICLAAAGDPVAAEDLGGCHRGALLEGLRAKRLARMVISWPDPVQPTLVEPRPWAVPDPDRWVTVTKTSTVPVALQVTSNGTSTAAPRARSRAAGYLEPSRLRWSLRYARPAGADL